MCIKRKSSRLQTMLHFLAEHNELLTSCRPRLQLGSCLFRCSGLALQRRLILSSKFPLFNQTLSNCENRYIKKKAELVINFLLLMEKELWQFHPSQHLAPSHTVQGSTGGVSMTSQKLTQSPVPELRNIYH